MYMHAFCRQIETEKMIPAANDSPIFEKNGGVKDAEKRFSWKHIFLVIRIVSSVVA